MRSGLPRLALLPLPLVTAPSPSSGHLPPAPSLSLRLGGTGDLSVERPEPYLSLYISSGGWAGVVGWWLLAREFWDSHRNQPRGLKRTAVSTKMAEHEHEPEAIAALCGEKVRLEGEATQKRGTQNGEWRRTSQPSRERLELCNTGATRSPVLLTPIQGGILSLAT